ncbi:unnamed protein product [Pedinophyceae sp. YPF-701]|nr:unnamed protein product [Pedinophyceae sp. YPF-701]
MSKDDVAPKEGGSGDEKANVEFKPSEGLTSGEAAELLSQYGRNELSEKAKPKWLIYAEQLYGPMPIMIWIAIIIEFAIQAYIDAAILLGIQFTNATIAYYETTKAGDAVAALKASLKPKATVKRDGTWQNMDAAELVPGDLVLLGAGSAVPADCLVNHGQIDVDQAALTGESLPVTFYRGDSAKMGSTVVRGEVEATVEFTGGNTFFGKTATLIQGVEGLGNLQKLLLKIMFILVGLSLVMCFTAFGYLMAGRDVPFEESVEFTVVVLVASIPIAIEIVVTTTLALGSKQLAAFEAIVTNLTAIEEMAGMNILCSDKTGTLTCNRMEIQQECPTFDTNIPHLKKPSRDDVLQYAALAAKWREPPRDALDTMVLGAANLDWCDKYKQIDFLPFDPTTKRTEATLVGPDGATFKVTKGAPHVILAMIDHKKEQLAPLVQAIVQDLGQRGIRSLTVAATDPDGKWNLMGVLTFLDPPRHDTKETIERAMAYGVDVKMITGDHTLIAKEMCRMLSMGDQVLGPEGLPTLPPDGKVPDDLGRRYGQLILDTDGFAQVFPEHKYIIVEALRQQGFGVGMTGDGVNDAPALKRADVGIAVADATDAARAAADIVLTSPGLSVVVEAIRIAREIFCRIKNFLNYRIAATLQLLFFFFIAVFAFDPKEYIPDCSVETVRGERPTESLTRDEAFCQEAPEFFSLPVIMLMLITLLNDGTLISIGYDNVIPSQRPEKWNLRVLFLISSVLGSIACVSSLILLWAALDSHNPSGVFAALSLPAMPYGKIVTMIYLKVSISDFLTLFSARTHETYFWGRRPGKLMMFAACFSMALSTILAIVWPDGSTNGIPVTGLAMGSGYKAWFVWVWLYCIVWWFIQDAAKVFTYWIVDTYDIFQYRTGAMVNLRSAHDPDDKAHPLARSSLAMVEHKLLERRLDSAAEEMENLSRTSPGLERMSQRMTAQRKSVTMMRRSMAGQSGGLSRASVLQGVVEELEEAAMEAKGLDATSKAAVEKNLREVTEAAQRLDMVARLGDARTRAERRSVRTGGRASLEGPSEPKIPEV